MTMASGHPRRGEPKKGWAYRRWAWVPLLLTLLIRMGWMAHFPADAIAPVDAEGFHLLAVNVMDGRGFAIGWEPPFCPTAVRTPLYPLFIAGTYTFLGRTPQAVVLVQALLEALTTALVIALARALVGHGGGVRGRLPLLAGLLYALNGSTQRFTGTLLSEALLLPILAAVVTVTVRLLTRPRLRLAAGAGGLWALALLTKPNGQFLVLAVGLIVTLRLLHRVHAPVAGTRRWAMSFLFWGVLAAGILPWVLRNRLVLDRWLFSTAFEENLARVSAVATRAALAGVTAEPWSETWEHLYRQMVVEVDPAAGVIAEPVRDVACATLDRYHREVAVAAGTLVRRHPGTCLMAHLNGVVQSLLDPGHRLWYHVLTRAEWQETGVVADIGDRVGWALARGAVGDALEAFWQERVVRIPPRAAAIWWGLALGRLGAVWLTWRGLLRLRSMPFVALLLLAVVAYHIVLPGPIAHDRFYVPAIPVVVVLIAHGAAGRYNS